MYDLMEHADAKLYLLEAGIFKVYQKLVLHVTCTNQR